MHLAYLDPHPVPDECPEALQILYTVDALGQLGVKVTLITPVPQAGVTAETILGRKLSTNVRFWHLPGRAKRWWLPVRSNKPFYAKATTMLPDIQPDAVLARNLKMAEHVLRRAPRIPLFFETHEVFAQTFREEHPNPSLLARVKLNKLVNRENFVYRNAEGLVVLTPLLLEDIRQEYGIDTPAVVAPDGVELQQATASKRGKPNEMSRLFYLGSLHPWKGVDTLIRAMAYVRPGISLYLVGGNPQRVEELKNLALDLGVENRIVFVGPVPHGQRFEWIHQADICLLPLTESSIGSRYTSPLKLFEYLAAGKPVIASDLPSMRSILVHGKHAILAKSGDPRAFAEAIEQLLADTSLRQRLGENARRLAENFTWTARADIIRHVIDGHLASRQKSRSVSEVPL